MGLFYLGKNGSLGPGFAAGDANVYRYVGNSPANYADPSGLCPDDDFLTTSGGFFYGFGMGLKDAAIGFGGMFKTAGEGFGDLAFATYNGDFNDPWLAANAVDNDVNRAMDGAAQDYLALSEDPSLAFDVAVNDTTDWFLDKLRSPENIGKLAADVFLTFAPSAKGFAGAEADAKIGQFLADESGSLKIGRSPSPTTKGGTYKLVDPETGQVMRTGRTGNLVQREGQHSLSPATKDLKFEVDRHTDIYAQQRGREEIIHDQYKPPMNKINPISPRNPSRQNAENGTGPIK